MSLRRSFFDVNGYPDEKAAGFDAFLQKYHPDEDQQILHVITRSQIAMRRYLKDQYPDMTDDEARLIHKQASRERGDLKLRIEPETFGRESIKEACEQFRNACRWWQKGERSTAAMLVDAKEFEAIAGNWDKIATMVPADDDELWGELVLRRYTPSDDATKHLIKREVEITGQFAVEIVEAIDATNNWVGMNQDEIRTKTFQDNLQRVFSSFDHQPPL